ncbi:NAD-dependent succinate-semialdehyde dehydrogenase [uncultured Thalassospira sp.]|uniref:NAD-dependent succinate-semialdehyde dehydrogenase n=1 Tax=uncultured Thalassospira sp. TaxID=404382 RepID=UPI0030DBC68F|tara:strand:- start:8092 stop:9609 length:1518 start_codon:yes stop_codon:yes gene_type:complete
MSSADHNSAPLRGNAPHLSGLDRACALIHDWSLHKAYINGEWQRADSGETIEVLNPSTGKLLADVAFMRTSEARRAIDAAADAFLAWSGALAKDRAAVLRRWRDLMELYLEDLACLITAEQGKPIDQARREVVGAIAYAEWYGEEARRAYGQTMPGTQADRRVWVQKQAVGVVAAITPWNFPLTMVVRKCAPALAAGCSVVVKPAEDTPLCALAVAKLAEMAGFPKGVFNVVTGTPVPIAQALTDDFRVRMLSFTGSTPVGKRLIVQCADTVKKTAMELGGNAPFIVMDDARIDDAVTGAMISKYRNSGQTCVCANRILVQSGVYDAFVEKFIAATRALRMGDGFDAHSEIGPLINSRAVAKVERLMADAKRRGGVFHEGAEKPGAGYFVRPTVITDLPIDADCFEEELFAPIAPIYRFDTEAEAITLANRVKGGLSSYLYSRDIGRIHRIADALQTGVVGINDGTTSHEGAPFGGVKESGHGREGGHWGLDEYLEVKYLNIALT